MRRYRGAALRKEEEDMATIVQDSASMETLTAPAPVEKVAHDIQPVSDHRPRTSVVMAFLLFLGLWYAFSPYLPQTVRQYFQAIVH